jgi:outer membrane immunogenic protein
VLALTASTGATRAADFPAAPYSVAATYSWIGPYVGGNLGYEWSGVTNNPTNPSGLTGGIEGGYNWQSGQFVFGGETDLDLSAANDTFAPWKFSNPWFGTFRARAGWALNNILFYGTAGFAYGGVRVDAGGATETHIIGGWTAGAGMEVGFTPNWSAKVEYLYVNLGSTSYTLTGMNNGLQSGVLRLGVNYRF